MENFQFIKNIALIEIELGFIRIPNEYKNIFPKESSHINVCLDESDRKSKLYYNSKHQRIFGLRSFFKLKNVEPKNILKFEKISNNFFKISLDKKLKN